MKIRTTDIPAGGRELAFDYGLEELNQRLSEEHRNDGPHRVAVPEYRFVDSPKAEIKITLEGSTVMLEGRARGSFVTQCSRCAEETKQDLDVPVHLILKPGSAASASARRTAPSRGELEAADEDLNFGFYFNQEIDCDQSTQDFLILSLPFTVLCSEGCKGLCPDCGANLNAEACRCRENSPGDERLSLLRNLKLN